jgi:O-methyltransferase
MEETLAGDSSFASRAVRTEMAPAYGREQQGLRCRLVGPRAMSDSEQRAVRLRIRSELAPRLGEPEWQAPLWRRTRARFGALRTDLRWAVRWLRAGPDQREQVGITLLARLAEVLCPRYVLTDPEKAWYDDVVFFRAFYSLERYENTADRRYLLAQLLFLAESVPGDTAECGVYAGTSSWFICEHFAGSGRLHHGFDSFAGLSEPKAVDGAFWRSGDLQADECAARELLSPYDAQLYPGWIPERFDEVAERRFAFVHVDVDLYEPTRDSFAFFYPRVSPGGILLCDDYGFTTCPGARRAVDEFMAEKPEPVVHLPTGQGVVIKQAAVATRPI